MTEDERPEAEAGLPIVDMTGTEIDEVVVLPAHASAYYSPRTPPAATEHRTIETDAVRLDPSIDVGLAETRRLNVERSSFAEVPPANVLSDAPTVLLRRAPSRSRKRAVAAVAVIWVLVLGLSFIRWSQLARNDAASRPSATGALAVAPVAETAPQMAAITVAASSAPPVTVAASESQRPAATVETPAAPAISDKTSAPRAKSHATPMQSVPRAAAAGTPAHAAWIDPSAPKAWIK